LDFFGDIPIISLRSEPLQAVSNRIRKRIFDIVVSLVGIVFILSLLIPTIGLAIYLESPGPIFFMQTRSGKNNRNFKCIKFRSMTVNKDADQKQATRDDSRITRVGKFIRKTSIDEFPQLFNVLRGDMSMVGPRPHMVYHTECYSKTVNQYMVRQFLTPGITGWAQVNGFRGETQTIEQMQGRIDHDLWYLENWSLWLDVRIIFLTAFNVFRGEENAC
jgi:putative colanic acid biosynthesis UDP-glucose lipid carrier transferase